jgi:hypothetical protein
MFVVSVADNSSTFHCLAIRNAHFETMKLKEFAVAPGRVSLMLILWFVVVQNGKGPLLVL